MKKWMSLLVIFMFLGIMTSPAIAANGPMGPAPNSGDCDPDGSGFNGPGGPNGPDGSGISGSDGSASPGPAPNSGDGDPDGSGF